MTSRLVQYHLLTNVSFLSRCKMLSSSHSLQAHVEHRSAVPVGCFPVPFILLCLPANTPDILTARRAGRRMRQEASPEGGRGHRGGRWKTDDGKHRRGVPLESDKKCKSLRSPTLSFPLTQTATEKKKSAGGKTESEEREREKKRQEQEIKFIAFALSSLPIISLGEGRLQCLLGLLSYLASGSAVGNLPAM